MKLYQWQRIPVEDLGGGVTRQLITTDNMMLSQIYVPAGVKFPMHGLNSEQLTIYLKGSAVYESESSKIEAREGDIVHIPAGAAHADEITEDCVVLDIFSPPRSDWLKK